MSVKIVHVLCEGQTEQGFVEEVLKPYLMAKGITSVKSVLVTTNKKKNARGGLVTYQHAFDDLSIMLKSNTDGEYERHIYLQRCLTCMRCLAISQGMRNRTLLMTGIPESHYLNEHFMKLLGLKDSCRIFSFMSMRHWSFVGWITCR